MTSAEIRAERQSLHPKKWQFLTMAFALALLPMATQEETPPPVSILSSEIKPSATLEQIEALMNESQEPVEMILRRLQLGEVRLLALGELHRVDVMEDFGEGVIRRAAEEGLISFLSLEIYSIHQTDMNTYLLSGEMSPELQAVFDRHHAGYRRIVDVAREFRLAVICADTHEHYRDETMSLNTLSYMQENPDEVGVFYAGNAHITEPRDLLPQKLGDGYYSVMQIEASMRNDTLADAARAVGLETVVGIENLDSSVLGNARWGFFTDSVFAYRDAVDAVVIHPEVEKR